MKPNSSTSMSTFFILALAACLARESAGKVMEKHEIVPDIIDVGPQQLLEVTYENISLKISSELTPTQVKNEPIIKFTAEPKDYYLLVMTESRLKSRAVNSVQRLLSHSPTPNETNSSPIFPQVSITSNPDAPSRRDPKVREWQHWLVGNIPGSAVKEGQVLSEYVGSGPPRGSGLHRYVLLVYKQPGKITFNEPHLTNRSGDGRGKFSTKKFAQKYDLGNPVFGNFFLAQYDDYVPKLYQQLKGKTEEPITESFLIANGTLQLKMMSKNCHVNYGLSCV